MAKEKKEDFGDLLSPLESHVLDLVWKEKKARVREIYAILKKHQKVALTSVAVILDRLYDKGIVGRDIESAKGGLRYIYYPLKDRKQLARSIMEENVDTMIERFGDVAVNYFSERFSKKR